MRRNTMSNSNQSEQRFQTLPNVMQKNAIRFGRHKPTFWMGCRILPRAGFSGDISECKQLKGPVSVCAKLRRQSNGLGSINPGARKPFSALRLTF